MTSFSLGHKRPDFDADSDSVASVKQPEEGGLIFNQVTRWIFLKRTGSYLFRIPNAKFLHNFWYTRLQNSLRSRYNRFGHLHKRALLLANLHKQVRCWRQSSSSCLLELLWGLSTHRCLFERLWNHFLGWIQCWPGLQMIVDNVPGSRPTSLKSTRKNNKNLESIPNQKGSALLTR